MWIVLAIAILISAGYLFSKKNKEEKIEDNKVDGNI